MTVEHLPIRLQGFLGGAVIKNPSANTGDTGDASSVPGSGRSPREETATHSCILAWEVAWKTKPGGLQFMGSQKSRTHLGD